MDKLFDILNYSAISYLDPGTGSLIIQLAIATFVAGGAFIKIKWSAIKKYFSKNK